MESIEKIREGMHVVDKQGNAIGSVKELKMGDTGAVTSDGQVIPHNEGITDFLGKALESNTAGVPPEEAERLLRVGYIKVSRSGLFSGNLHVAADEIDRVEGDTVHLAIHGDDRTT